MHDTATEIKQHIDIVEFLSKYITLQKAGRNFKALCPFHKEKTPSFMVSPDRQSWRCFGACQTGGDILSFFMKWDNCTFYEALTELAKMAGVEIKSSDAIDDAYKRKNKYVAINVLASKIYQYFLDKPKINSDPVAYLKTRQINKKIQNTFQIGFAPPTPSAIVQYLQKKGYSITDIIDAGLGVKTYRGKIIDRFRNRIMFPLCDARGNIVGFSGRTLSHEKTEAKYINSPETYTYKKRETLFGIHLTKKSIQDNNNAIIVEGEFDMISCYQHSITNVVAIKGSAFTDEQLTLLSRYTDTLTLALDTDASGLTTTKRILPETERYGFKVQIAVFTEGKDPDEALQKNEILFKKSITSPIPVYDFIMDFALQKYNVQDPYEKAELIKEIAPFFTKIENPIIYEHYMKKVSTQIGVDTPTIERAMTEVISKKTNLRPQMKNKKQSNTYENEMLLTALFFQSNNHFKLFDTYFSPLMQSSLENIAIKKLFLHFSDYKKNNENYDQKRFTSLLPSELVEIIDIAYMTDLTLLKNDDFDKKIEKILLTLRYTVIKRTLKSYVTQKEKGIEKQAEIQSLMEERSAIEKKLAFM